MLMNQGSTAIVQETLGTKNSAIPFPYLVTLVAIVSWVPP